FVAHFFHHQGGGVLIQNLVDGRHHTHPHQGFDHFTGFYRHFRRQITHGDGFRQFYLVHHRSGRTGKGVFIGLTTTATTRLGLAFAAIAATQTAATVIVIITETAVFALINALFIDGFIGLFTTFFLTGSSGFGFGTLLCRIFFHADRCGLGSRFGIGLGTLVIRTGSNRFHHGFCSRCRCRRRRSGGRLSFCFQTRGFFSGCLFGFLIQLFTLHVSAFLAHFNGHGFFAALAGFQRGRYFTL